MRMKLKSIGIISLAKIQALTLALVGFLMGVIYFLLGIIYKILGLSNLGVSGILFGPLAIIIYPIFYGIIGFIGGAITAFLYNLIANWIGGVEIELENK